MARSLMGNYEEIQHQRIIRAIENLYYKTQSAILFNGSTGEWFRTTVGFQQGCLLSPTLFNTFLGRIMCEPLDDHEDSVSTGGRLITNSRFADDIVVNAEEEEAGILVEVLDTTTIRYKWRSAQTRQKWWQPKWLPKRSEARISGEIQLPWSNHLQRRIKTRDSFQDSTDNSSSF